MLSGDAADIVNDVKEGPVDQTTQAQLTQKWMGTAPKGAATPQVSGETDSAGEMWDGAIHSEKRSKTTDGRWRRKRGAGPGPRTRAAHHDTPSVQADSHATPEVVGSLESPPEVRPLAEATVTTFVGVLTMIGGPGWKAESQEMEGMVNAWEAYYRVRGVRELPPELMLAMVMGTYIGTRAMDDTNMEGFRKVASRFTRSRNIPNARPDSGSNGAGQINVTPTARERVSRTQRADGALHDSPERL